MEIFGIENRKKPATTCCKRPFPQIINNGARDIRGKKAPVGPFCDSGAWKIGAPGNLKRIRS